MTDDLGWLIQRYDSLASTMDVASQFARFSARERTVVVSAEQTAGRGRGGRSWKAMAGSAVFATAILRPPVAAHRLSTLPLIVGVAVAEAIEEIARCTVRLKWPNDVLLPVNGGAAKVAGVLVTSSLRGDDVDHVLVGIGINVRGGAQDLPAGATTIEAATSVSAAPDDVLTLLLQRFAIAYDAFVTADGRTLLAEWLTRAAFLGEVVTLEDAGRSVTGRFVGIDEDGSLLLAEPGHPVRKMVAGDLVRGPRRQSASGVFVALGQRSPQLPLGASTGRVKHQIHRDPDGP